MMMAEGVARQLNPKADMWQLAKPLAEDWMAREASFSKQAEKAAKEILALTTRLPALLDALERPHTELLPPSPWPLRLAITAIGLAIISIFTHFH